MKKEIKARQISIKTNILKGSAAILQYAVESANNFLQLYNKSRGKKFGASTDEEQDLLRAMLLFSTAGLDALVKRLINDSLHFIATKDARAKQTFETFVGRKIKIKAELADSGHGIDIKLLSKLLSSDSPRRELVSVLKSDLTANSLQSRKELVTAAAYFGVAMEDLKIDPGYLDNIFRVRNEITHEMDILLEQKNRKRRHRKSDEMVRYAKEIFRIGEDFLSIVDTKLFEMKQQRRLSIRDI